jgi:hypothetical protein
VENHIILENYLEFLHYVEQSDILTEQEIEILVEGISKEKIVNLTKKKLQIVEKLLKKMKINVGKLRGEAKKAGEKIQGEFKKGTKPEDVGKILTKHAIKNLKAHLNQIEDMELGEKIALGFVGFLVVFYFNSVIMTALMMVLSSNPELVMQITAVVVAPMIEEALKSYFINKNMPWTGTLIFSGFELIQYLIQGVFGGLKITKMLIIRLTSLLMHFSTTFIQKKIIETSKEHDIDEDKAAFIAWVTAVVIHASWNTLALYLNPSITAWATK